ncbi:MAG: hypothetical protein D4S00_09245 [Streptomycetaceae bacterium]|nr:MAG: hypothetical protein D4S00_09245 [Streptomycetaceae bacterium]
MFSGQRAWKLVLFGALGGAALGVVARLWMRWISTDPEFTWGGTLGIVIAFTVFTTIQTAIYVLRRKVVTRRLTSVARGVGIFFTLPLFTAAGSIMFPTVALSSIALWQKKMDRKVRIALCVIGSIIPILQIKGFISNFGWTIATLGRVLLFIAIYVIVVILIKPTISPFTSEPRLKRVEGLNISWK